MKDNFDQCMDCIFAREGGYVNDPHDRGGPTNLGITQATLSAYRGRKVSIDEVKKLGKNEARIIYRTQYWDTVRGDELPLGLDLMVFDMSVNSGPSEAAKTLQRVLGVTADGVIGLKTMDAISKGKADSLILAYYKERLAFYKQISTWRRFGEGWTNRLNIVKDSALRMTRRAPVWTAYRRVEGESAKALVQDKSLIAASPKAGAIVTLIGAFGPKLHEQAAVLQPLVGQSKWLDMAFSALTIGGILYTFWTLADQIKDAPAPAKSEVGA